LDPAALHSEKIIMRKLRPLSVGCVGALIIIIFRIWYIYKLPKKQIWSGGLCCFSLDTPIQWTHPSSSSSSPSSSHINTNTFRFIEQSSNWGDDDYDIMKFLINLISLLQFFQPFRFLINAMETKKMKKKKRRKQSNNKSWCGFLLRLIILSQKIKNKKISSNLIKKIFTSSSYYIVLIIIDKYNRWLC